ncbi:hypothetical protein ACFWFZ_13585 [Streptomyces sp. NPDC060232]|uniref:hypothetical protein n=1 Tax=Streptomyces sp. NPDC060232 TaxID=3347079 RepID=UPI00365EF317
MLSEGQARALAEEFLLASRVAGEPEFAILWDLARVKDGVLVAPYNSVRFMETRDYSDQLLDCWPILVDMSSSLVRFARIDEPEFWGAAPEDQQ